MQERILPQPTDEPFSAVGATKPEPPRFRQAERRSLLVGIVVGLPISALFLVLATRNVDFDRVWDTLADARPGLVILGIALLGVVYAVQAERWRLFTPTGAPGWPRYYEMVLSGLAVNNVVPGRIGDLLRARWLSTSSDLPGGRALATVVLDRGSDLVTLVLFLVASLWFVSDAAWLRGVLLGSIVAVGLLLGLLAFSRLYVRARRRERREGRGMIRRLARDTIEGLAAPVSRPRVLAIAGLSILAWAVWAVGALVIARALGIDLSLVDTIFATAVINLGVAIPSSPGYVGTYQWLAVSALGLYGIARDEALAFAILLHAAWYVPTTIVGGVLLLWRGVLALRRRAADQRKTESVESSGSSTGVQ